MFLVLPADLFSKEARARDHGRRSNNVHVRLGLVYWIWGDKISLVYFCFLHTSCFLNSLFVLGSFFLMESAGVAEPDGVNNWCYLYTGPWCRPSI